MFVFVFQFYNSTGISLKEYLELTDPASNFPEYMQRYADNLKNKHLHHFDSISDDEWPPVGLS